MNEKIDLEQIEGSEGFGFPLSNLATANKSSLVGAINEVKGAIPNTANLVPYTGAAQDINLNDKSFYVGGVLTKVKTKVNLSPSIIRLEDVASIAVNGALAGGNVFRVNTPINYSVMFWLKFAYYEYQFKGYEEFVVTGYWYQNAIGYNHSVTSLTGRNTIESIRLGVDSEGKMVVYVVPKSSAMQYPKLILKEVGYTHAGVQTNHENQYNIITTTDLTTNFTQQQNITNTQFIRDSYLLDYNNFSNKPNLANYALLSQVYTQSQALGLFVGLNGVQTINDTKTFSSSPIVPNATLNNHAVNLGQLTSYVSDRANVRLSNLVSDLSTTEKATIKNKLGVIDTTYTNGTGLDLTNNVFSITIAIQNSISKGFTAYGWGNHASAGYALSSQLANYVPVNGAFTINGTKTFSSSPVVPNATLSSHAVNLGQVYNIVNNVIISNDIVEFDLLITDEFQSILDNIPQIGIEYAKCYYRNKTLGVAITIKNSSSSPVDVFGSSTSIVSLFTLPDEIMYRINQSIRDLIPQFKLQNSDPVSSYSSYQTFVELEGTIKHPYGLLLSENYKTVIYGEFECLDIL